MVKINFNKGMNLADVNDLILEKVNPVISLLIDYLSTRGYEMINYIDLRDETTDVLDMDYVMHLPIQHNLNLKKMSGCLTSIFNITNYSLNKDSKDKGVIMRFKRVENYNETDSQDAFIIDMIQPHFNYSDNDIIQFLKQLDVVPTSMIDISDGLASEILHLCKASKVGCHVYDEKVPIDAKTSMTAIDFNLDPNTCALNGGEDYELLFTIDQKDFDKIKGNPHMTVIGHITHENDGIYYVDKNGSAITLKAQGWKHF